MRMPSIKNLRLNVLLLRLRKKEHLLKYRKIAKKNVILRKKKHLLKGIYTKHISKNEGQEDNLP